MLVNNDTFVESNNEEINTKNNVYNDSNVNISFYEETTTENDSMLHNNLKRDTNEANRFFSVSTLCNYLRVCISFIVLFVMTIISIIIIVCFIGIIGQIPSLFHDVNDGNCMPISKLIYKTNCYYTFERLKFTFFVIGLSNVIEILLYCFVLYGIFGIIYIIIRSFINICKKICHKIKKCNNKTNIAGDSV